MDGVRDSGGILVVRGSESWTLSNEKHGQVELKILWFY
jgi:hypothetical protein